MKRPDSSHGSSLGAFACVLCVLTLAGAGAWWVLVRRSEAPSSHEARGRLLQPAVASAGAPASAVASEEGVRPTAPPEREQTVDELILSLEQSALAKDDHAAIEAIVGLGARLRTKYTGQTAGAAVVHSITTSRNPQLIGLLCYALASYGVFPEGLLPSLITSPSTHHLYVPALANAETLARVPEDWEHEKLIRYWEQLFMAFPTFLPGPLHAEIDKVRAYFERGGCVVCPSDILSLLPRRKLSNPGTIDAVFQRVLREGEDGAWILRSLEVSVDMSDEGVAERVAALLAGNPGPRVRQELADWLAWAPPEIARRELFKLYCLEPDPDVRKRVGFALIVHDSEEAPTVFRTLWERENNEDVRLALVGAMGYSHADAILEELARVHATGDDAIKKAVEEDIADKYRVEHSETAKKLLLQFGVPIPPPATIPDFMLPPTKK